MKVREIYSGGIYHIYNRGTLAMNIFRNDRDYKRFVAKLFYYQVEFDVEVLVYCLMPNHFHLVLKEPEVGSSDKMSNISYFMRSLMNAYVKYFVAKYNHSGNVLQGRYKCKYVDKDSYYVQLRDYVLDNPVRCGLVSKRSEWKYLGFNDSHLGVTVT